MAGRRNLASVKAAPAREPAPDLRDAVATAVGAMKWLTDSDKAMRALALRLADEIERAAERAEVYAAVAQEAAGQIDVYKRLQKLESMCDATKVVGWLGPQLQGVLRDLGGTPAARAAMAAGNPIGGRLAELRAAAAATGRVDNAEAVDPAAR